MISLEDIKYNYNNGYISIVKHPYAELHILNYTKKASQEAVWNEVTLNSRGLIINTKGKIISLPFRKFFEIEQLPTELTPSKPPVEILEKLDGALGIMYWYKDIPYISTRGSFTSFQAIRATEVLHKKYSKIFYLLDRNCTYLFEIILPENRVVIDYGNLEDLYLIGVINNETQEEISIHDYKYVFSLPQKFEVNPGFSLQDLYEMKTEKILEGFVLKYDDGFRIKVKNKDYRARYQFYAETIRNYALEKVFLSKTDHSFEEKLSASDSHWLEILMNNIILLKEKSLANNDTERFGIIKNRVFQNQFFTDIGNFKEKFLY
ncbi:hypothetical protein BBI01_18545 [Chryseobacterium artocarpi]|uniref:T4 RNA ligase 1-like N-terminal domain-containing protein n=1 Tax=Chryseobacterium artocarpi TaxID=1414727 RepID=A0A1B8ZA53_9FLAO|nr:RNA ligase [Chryseobacterium artocarpi]OCA68444.1 hypothetical protein BBI01_18545 [Chryseobacterium artocarpi]